MSNGSGSRTKLSTRFLVWFAVAYLILIGLMAFIVDRAAKAALVDEIDHNLTVAARLSQQSLPEEEAEYEEWAGEAYSASGFRTTLIDGAGVVVADSHSTPELVENHLDRPEVQTALRGEVGVDSRISESTGFEQRYLALPPADGLIVRTSVPVRVIEDVVASLRTAILATAVVLGLVGAVVVAFLGRRLAQPIAELTDQARAVAEGATEVRTTRSRVQELDELGVVISAIATRLGSRVADAETATATMEVVLGALPQGTILIDDAGRVAYANPSAYSILGDVPDELGGLAPLQLQNAVREAKENREQVDRVIDHGSPARRIRGVATPFAGDERVLLLLVDVTERERTDSVRRDFVANASHELKTPVSTIIASSEALRIAIDRGDESASAFAAGIEDSARQLDRLVGDLLDLSRLEKDRPEMAPARLDHLVRDEVERIRGSAESKGL
ncbi:MAG TPA: histidine kinase dimerization/phospho-acceptor domain-containing protein, partial [Acidimicrobiia bacterium]|nr:histidine kinase dimerization/phospho-acceptor domain-containing protein [Acidimicrobiia bacterium]